MIIDRVDFVVPGARCARTETRTHGFPRTDTAFIVINDQGKEMAYGRRCLILEFGNDAPIGVPNFTARNGNAPTSGGGSGGGSGGACDLERMREAVARRYLILRMRCLANQPGISKGIFDQRLAAPYSNYQRTGRLTASEVDAILSVESNAPASFKGDNLLDVYTAMHQLDLQIRRRSSPSAFLDSLRSQVLGRLSLSAAQVTKAGLTLHPTAFP